MIRVAVMKSEQVISGFELSGHADSGPYGYDLVCAGVSAISFGATNALFEVGGIEPFIDQHHDGGFLSVTIPNESKANATIQVILKTMLVSLETIEREYGQFIQIKMK